MYATQRFRWGLSLVVCLAAVSACGDDERGGGGAGGYGGFAGFGGAAGAAGGGDAGYGGFAGTNDAGFGGFAGTNDAGFGGFAGTNDAGFGGFAGTNDAGFGGFAGTNDAGFGGTGGDGGVGGDGGSAGSGGTGGGGSCCPSGDCICRGAVPSALTASAGAFTTATYTVSTGTVHYPTNAEPPYSAVAVCGGLFNTGPEMAPWGPFYASHGIVTIVVDTIGTDVPEIRATKLLAAIETLKSENTRSGSALFGKLAGRYGTSGYSMGGGGTTRATVTDPTLRTSVGLAAWQPVGTGITVPTLLLCGTSDTTAPCSMSTSSYGGIPSSTPKMQVSITGASHFAWFGPTDAGMGTSGRYALAFQKVFLDGDERWRSLLLSNPSNGTQTTNIR